MKTLAKICLDATLLAQRAEGEPLPDGYAFQRAIAQLLRMPGMRCVQAAGLTRLWGFESASGAPHELDAAAKITSEAYVIEAKAGGSVSKADLAVFELKLTDFYFGRWRELTKQRWHPILIVPRRPATPCGAWRPTVALYSVIPSGSLCRSCITMPRTRRRLARFPISSFRS